MPGDGKERGSSARTGSGQSGLATSVAGTDDQHVVVSLGEGSVVWG